VDFYFFMLLALLAVLSVAFCVLAFLIIKFYPGHPDVADEQRDLNQTN
jgi:hypothetical protein